MYVSIDILSENQLKKDSHHLMSFGMLMYKQCSCMELKYMLTLQMSMYLVQQLEYMYFLSPDSVPLLSIALQLALCRTYHKYSVQGAIATSER